MEFKIVDSMNLEGGSWVNIAYTKSGGVGIFAINRPRVRNALNMEAIRELHKALVDFRDDSELLVGIITGGGEEAFCAGADVTDTLPFMKEHRDVAGAFPALPTRGLDIWKPLIAAINGLALGGGLELALACDIRIAATNAKLGVPEVGLGLIPGWGGTQRLPRAIPWAKAAELILMGRTIDAQEAYRIGLVNKVVELDELMRTAREWAEILCQRAALAVRAAKEAMIRGLSLSLEEGLRLESSLEDYLLGTEDFTEGITAFAEKRKPVFKAR